MYTPTLEQAEELASQGNLVPVYREINADLETPVSAYLKVARPPNSFLLESVEGGERIARYSFIGTEPYDVVKTGPGHGKGAVDPLAAVQEALARLKVVAVPGLERFSGGAVGYISYDAAGYFERLPSPASDPLGLPESVFMLATTFLIFDHLRHKIRVVSYAHLDGDVERAYLEATTRIDEIVDRLDSPLPSRHRPASRLGNGAVSSNMSPERFKEMVREVQERVIAGEVIQTVVSQRLSRPTSAHPFEVYRALRAINPSPYMFFLELDDFHVVGASPEMLVRCVDGDLDYHPIAGTLRRGVDPEEDRALERRLRADEKERAEHIMLVDLGRNDVGRVSEPGTVRVTELMEVERYSHVMHLVSHVTGRLRADYSNYDALRACFPAGTVAGAPKIRAMEIIAELEPDKRGLYAGAVGYFDLNGNMDTAIAIRTLVIKDSVAHIQAGSGIVYDSVPESEFQESLDKASAVLRAIEQAEAGA